MVEVIDRLFPGARSNRRATVRTGPQLAAIVALTKEIPAELLTLTEALLLWAVQEAERQKKGAIAVAVSLLVGATTLPQKPSSDPERWNLIELIEVSLKLGLITSETATQARLGKNFRNLIHPGRAARLGQVCDRATALSALAAVEHVVRDLR